MQYALQPHILDYLTDMEEAVEEIANTWRPDDPQYRADVYRQILCSLSYSYFAYFHATPEHPDWAPLWNPVYTLQPNPDDIYLYSPIRGDLSYRVSGNRGTIKILNFTTQRGMSGMVESRADIGGHNDLDDGNIDYGDNGDFEILFSRARPADYEGNWAPIAVDATGMMVRLRSYDWINETSPQLTIECLDRVPLKPRLSASDITERIREMARFPVRKSRLYYAMQNAIRDQVGVNAFQPQRIEGALTQQVYWPAVFELEEGEALIIETGLPKVCPYWNIQLNDPYFNAIEYVYRLSSTNGAMATLSSDGKFRGVIALEDPGVPNWLDPAGFKEGTIYGRWYGCDSAPTPIIKRVSLSGLREHLPADTKVISVEERAEELRQRVLACQRRRRW
jgi:Protein of unknown function (DUF1214)